MSSNFYENLYKAGDYSTGVKQDEPFFMELKSFIEKFNLKSKKILEIGSGTGTLQDVVWDYVGVDVVPSLEQNYHKPFFVIENEKYPFSLEFFDAIFTRSVFEHIPNIDMALEEMLRVLKSGGYILFSPAWQVRPWAAAGYTVRNYKDLNWKGKLIKFSIIWRNNIFFRLLLVIPKRILRTLIYVFNKNYFQKLPYKKLTPNYEKMWDADSDACNSIDPHAAILYFFSHGHKVLNYPNLWQAFFVRNGSLVIQKKHE